VITFLKRKKLTNFLNYFIKSLRKYECSNIHPKKFTEQFWFVLVIVSNSG